MIPPSCEFPPRRDSSGVFESRSGIPLESLDQSIGLWLPPEERAVKTSSADGSRPGGTKDLYFPDIWQVLVSRWHLVLAGLAVGWVAAVAYFLVVPSTYESEAQLLVMRKDPRLAVEGVAGSKESESQVSEDLLATHMQIVQSQRIVSESLKSNGLDQLPSILEKLGEDETPADYVIDKLRVTRGGVGQARTAHVLNIAFRHSSAEECERILKALVAQYQSFLSEKFRDVNEKAAELIDQATKDLGLALEQAENEYQAYRETSPVFWKGEDSTNIHLKRYEEVQTELSQIELQTKEAETRLSVVEASAEEQKRTGANYLERLALIDEKNATRFGVMIQALMGTANTAQFQAQQPERLENARGSYEGLLALMVKEKTLLQDLGPQHPEVISVRSQMDVAKGFIEQRGRGLGVEGFDQLLDPEKLVDSYVQLLQHDLEALKRRGTELESVAKREEESAKELVRFELEGETLRNRVDTPTGAVQRRGRPIAGNQHGQGLRRVSQRSGGGTATRQRSLAESPDPAGPGNDARARSRRRRHGRGRIPRSFVPQPRRDQAQSRAAGLGGDPRDSVETEGSPGSRREFRHRHVGFRRAPASIGRGGGVSRTTDFVVLLRSRAAIQSDRHHQSEAGRR